MRTVLLLPLLLFSTYLNAQETPSFFGTKWYLNSAPISSSTRNDNSKINPSVLPFNYFIFTTNRLEIGMDSSKNQKAHRIFFECRINQWADHTGQISLYRTAKEKKKKMPFAYYEYTLTPFELVLTTSTENESFPDIAYDETLVFSPEKDSSHLSTKILGTWKPEPSPYKFFDQPDQDTIILIKSEIDHKAYDQYFYTFERTESVSTCITRFFVSPDIKDRMFYDVSNRYNYGINIPKKQLVFLGSDKKVYDILEVNDRQLILKFHRE